MKCERTELRQSDIHSDSLSSRGSQIFCWFYCGEHIRSRDPGTANWLVLPGNNTPSYPAWAWGRSPGRTRCCTFQCKYYLIRIVGIPINVKWDCVTPGEMRFWSHNDFAIGVQYLTFIGINSEWREDMKENGTVQAITLCIILLTSNPDVRLPGSHQARSWCTPRVHCI